ncbi:MAG: polyamine aminopropyltransferase [Thermotogae bacterium]|nr:polyamine aminopropyltransferase [Thermotogota bacterium]MCL5031897.1 polyamine aminopropyltransferase [Thermotogota bacterium]
MAKENMSFFFEETVAGGNVGTIFRVSKIDFSKQSAIQKIDIFSTPDLGKVLAMDGMVQLNERWEFTYHEMIVHVPLFSHPNPENVLVIGGGDGGAVREILKHKSVKRVDLVEIDPEIIKICKENFPTVASKITNSAVSIYNEDGKNFVARKHDQYDVIIVDSTDPYKGAGNSLFTGEFYASCRDALKEDGIISVQAENPVYDSKEMERCFGEIKKAFSIVKPYVAFVPMYPSGFWVFAYASKNTDPSFKGDESRIKMLDGTLIYYNRKIHDAAFVIPTFLEKLIG